MPRDDHRSRDKVTAPHGGESVGPVALAALVLFSAVFGLGVYVGKNLAAAAPIPAPHDNLDALDARKDAPPVAAPAPKAQVIVDDSAAREKAKEEETKAAEAKAAEAEAAKQRAAEKKIADAKAAEERSAREKAEREKAEKERAARDRSRAEAREKALAAAAAAARGKDAEPSAPAVSDEGAKGFTVQIGSSPSQDEADVLVAKARAAGMQPYVIEVDLGEKGTWYRTRVGSYPDKEAAERFRKKAEAELHVKGLVMPAQ